MASRKNIKAATAVLIAMGYCSLSQCKDRDVKIPPITLKDLFISVKTTRHYQYNRLPLIVNTWFQLAKEQIWFFTDVDNPQHQIDTNGHMVNTHCPTSHKIVDLCCKTGFEYDYFVKTNKRWFCHFDDDNYVNVPRLLSVLQGYDYNGYWYLGRTAYDVAEYKRFKSKRIKYWYGTGGAGYCLSRGLALKLLPIIGHGQFKFFCRHLRMPDDVNMGFIIRLLGSNLTQITKFHSHIEKLWEIKTDQLKDQISLSYDLTWAVPNVVKVPGFHFFVDPTRLLSLHCFLFPHFPVCSKFREFVIPLQKKIQQQEAYFEKLRKTRQGQRKEKERNRKKTKAQVIPK